MDQNQEENKPLTIFSQNVPQQIQTVIKQMIMDNNLMEVTFNQDQIQFLLHYAQQIRFQLPFLDIKQLVDPLILKKLTELSFINLQQINLENNGIQSIEQLSYCDIPHIRGLNLSYNYITSIDTLKKTQFSLVKINLRSNLIQTIEGLCEHKSQQLYSIDTRWNNGNEVIFFNQIAKIEAQCLRFAQIYSQSFYKPQKIISNKLKTVLKNKTKNLSVQ